MKQSIRENILAHYSLHDMNVIRFEISDDRIRMYTQSGIIRCSEPSAQVEGYVEFRKVEWDFSYAYRLDFSGNIGSFTGEKFFLKDFLESLGENFGLSIMDESYGYNSTKFSGFLSKDRKFGECFLEIYHEGDMVFVETEA